MPGPRSDPTEGHLQRILAGSGAATDRRVLEAALAAGAAAAAVWRLLPRGRGSSWEAVLESGPADALPSPREVADVLAGALPPELPPHRAVLGGAGIDRALVLAGVTDEAELDRLEALLLVAALADGGDAPPPALPGAA